MQQIIYFLKRFRYFLLFLILETIALYFTIQHHSYHKSRFVNSANAVSGGVYNKMSNVRDFFLLKSENQLLIEENTKLKNLLEKNHIDTDAANFILADSLNYIQKYNYTAAKVINNNYTKPNNFLTLNKGSIQGVKPDMGVINAKGIIGVVKNTSNRYASVMSILNEKTRINVRLKNSDHFGTLKWNGEDYNIVQITDIPRQALISKNDTIITGGKSVIFPEGILIGIVDNYKFENNQYQEINIRLFNDMSSIGHVMVVENLEKKEQLELEQLTTDE